MKLGTRGSELALKQAQMVADLIYEKTNFFPDQTVINSSGDMSSAPISEMGGRGIFIKELEQALMHHKVDCAVHSFKDMTSKMPNELEITAVLNPESNHDVLVSASGEPLKNLPKAAIIGTGSLRRKCLLLRLRPDLIIKDIRGNVPTRLKQLDDGKYDAIVLSAAGLERLGLIDIVSEHFDPHEFTIAPGQGVIAIQTRKNDSKTQDLMKKIDDFDQSELSQWDTFVMTRLGFDCSIPLGFAITKLDQDRYRHTLFIGNVRMKHHFYDDRYSSKDDLMKEILDQINRGQKNL